MVARIEPLGTRLRRARRFGPRPAMWNTPRRPRWIAPPPPRRPRGPHPMSASRPAEDGGCLHAGRRPRGLAAALPALLRRGARVEADRAVAADGRCAPIRSSCCFRSPSRWRRRCAASCSRGSGCADAQAARSRARACWSTASFCCWRLSPPPLWSGSCAVETAQKPTRRITNRGSRLTTAITQRQAAGA